MTAEKGEEKKDRYERADKRKRKRNGEQRWRDRKR